MKTIKVAIPGKEYLIQIGNELLLQELPAVIEQFTQELVVVVTNETIQKQYPFYVEKCLESTGRPVATCILPDGEQYKTLETLNTIFDFLFDHNANRKTLLIAFGGGVIGDMTGFAAATFMRGIPYLQIPTTLLAQVDSSVGGKTAVNHKLGKNSIGAFKQPVQVCIDVHFLKTLPERELKAGYFELIKHGIISNAPLFNLLEKHPDILKDVQSPILEEAIYASCQVKTRVVIEDETEKGIRATLNFGHTLGHLIETHTHYDKYLHGEAVGCGMVFAAYLSHRLGHLEESPLNRIIAFLKQFLIPIELPPLTFEQFQSLILHDKKSQQASVNYILINDIGDCFIKKLDPALLWEHFQQFLIDFPGVCSTES